MGILWTTGKLFFHGETKNDRPCAWQAARSLLAAFLAGALAAGSISPVFAQNPPQNPPANPVPKPAATPSGTNIAPVTSLGVASHSYSRAPRAFPNIFKPYQSQFVPAPVLVNSPRIDQLIHDNKLEISLQDAIELALENSLDIAVQRYYPWISDAGLLNANAGSSGFATPGVQIPASSALINPFVFFNQNFDPLVTSTSTVIDQKSPVSNPFLSGTALASIISHVAVYNNQ